MQRDADGGFALAETLRGLGDGAAFDRDCRYDRPLGRAQHVEHPLDMASMSGSGSGSTSGSAVPSKPISAR